MNVVTLDNVRNIKLDTKSPPLNNFQALFALQKGLNTLSHTVRQCELNQVSYRDIPLSSMFHWFSTSSVNYLRLVGLIDIMNNNGWKSADISQNKKNIRNHCTEYVKEVIPEIYKWRNKVSGHFSITDPREEDNLASLEISIMPQTAWVKPYWYVGMMQWHSGGHSSEMPKWSLTVEYEKLTKRCFPHLKINPIEEVHK
ncbi:hypothetical protein [Lacimicrobium sp. SS2-24]|uniref:hypothetical protein n=1 Tax=Lacimicrobium sp. SS2-24 TaxID=2005569 RepID=UPI000B4A99DB|nr:hypothetical protein [Lacimicrobium sp. SS2-24]